MKKIENEKRAAHEVRAANAGVSLVYALKKETEHIKEALKQPGVIDELYEYVFGGEDLDNPKVNPLDSIRKSYKHNE